MCIVGREARGLVACTVDGYIRVWDNIGFASDAFRQLHLNLEGAPRFLVSCDSFGVLLGMSNGVVIRLLLGSEEIEHCPLAPSNGMLSRMSRLFYQESTPRCIDGGDLVAIVPAGYCPDHISRYTYILSDERLQKWQLFKSQETV